MPIKEFQICSYKDVKKKKNIITDSGYTLHSWDVGETRLMFSCSTQQKSLYDFNASISNGVYIPTIRKHQHSLAKVDGTVICFVVAALQHVDKVVPLQPTWKWCRAGVLEHFKKSLNFYSGWQSTGHNLWKCIQKDLPTALQRDP